MTYGNSGGQLNHSQLMPLELDDLELKVAGLTDHREIMLQPTP